MKVVFGFGLVLARVVIDENILTPSIMRKFFFLAVVGLFSSNLKGQTLSYLDRPQLQTAATVDTLVEPDEIHFNINLSENDLRGKVSVEALEKSMIEALVSIGIEVESALVLKDVDSDYISRILQAMDIRKSKRYDLTVGSAKEASEVLFVLENHGISNISLGEVKFKHPESLELILRTKAMRKAKKQAEALVSPLDQKVGPVLSITENAQLYPLYAKVSGVQVRGARADFEYKAPEIRFEPIKFSQSVNVVFAINQ
jgi:hypothetical protein